MKHDLEDDQLSENNIPIFYYNIVVICLSINPIMHLRTKYIEIKHHVIRNYC